LSNLAEILQEKHGVILNCNYLLMVESPLREVLKIMYKICITMAMFGVCVVWVIITTKMHVVIGNALERLLKVRKRKQQS